MRALLAAIQEAVRQGDFTYSAHAFERAEERDISPIEIEEAILATNAEIIEDYADDSRGRKLSSPGLDSDNAPNPRPSLLSSTGRGDHCL